MIEVGHIDVAEDRRNGRTVARGVVPGEMARFFGIRALEVQDAHADQEGPSHFVSAFGRSGRRHSGAGLFLAVKHCCRGR